MDYDEEEEDYYPEPRPGTVVISVPRATFWIVIVLLILALINTFMVLDMWLVLQHFRDFLQNVQSSLQQTGQ